MSACPPNLIVIWRSGAAWDTTSAPANGTCGSSLPLQNRKSTEYVSTALFLRWHRRSAARATDLGSPFEHGPAVCPMAALASIPNTKFLLSR